jgi:outer membrane protein assembly factor BamB
MNRIDRDALIRAALTPAGDLPVPADLAETIHGRLVATPQRRAGLAAPLRRLVPEMPVAGRPIGAWLAAALLLLAGLAVVAGIASQRDRSFPAEMTSYHGGPSQDGVMPGPGPVGIPTTLWQQRLDAALDNWSVPLVRDGVIYVVDLAGSLQARDAATGEMMWDIPDLGAGIHAPVLLGDMLVMVSDEGLVTAIDVVTRELAWQQELALPVIASMAGSDGTAIVSSSDGVAVALSVDDGSERYRVRARGPVNRSPAIANGIVHLADDSGLVTAFRLADGEIVWEADLTTDDTVPVPSPEVSTPVYSNGSVYLVRGPFDMSAPHEVVALDGATGGIRWRWTSPSLDRLFVGTVTDDAVYTVGEDGWVRRLGLDGTGATELYHAAGGIGALSTVFDDTLYVSSYDGMVQAIDRSTGERHWQVVTTGMPTMPVVIDERVVVGTGFGELRSIGMP